MHKNASFSLGFIFYFLLVSLSAVLFDLSGVTTIVIMLALPIFFLARYSAAPTVLILTVTGFGIGVAILLEGIAHIYGLWTTELTSGSGLVPLGLATVTFLKVLFLVLFYELLFDDGLYEISKARSRFVEFIFFGVGALILVFIFAKVFEALSSPTAYYWLTMILFGTCVGMLTIK